MGGKVLNLSVTSGTRMLFGLLLCHSAGMCFMTYAIYSRTTLVFPPAYPVTAAMANDTHVYGKVDGSFWLQMC